MQEEIMAVLGEVRDHRAKGITSAALESTNVNDPKNHIRSKAPLHNHSTIAP